MSRNSAETHYRINAVLFADTNRKKTIWHGGGSREAPLANGSLDRDRTGGASTCRSEVAEPAIRDTVAYLPAYGVSFDSDEAFETHFQSGVHSPAG